MSDGDALPANSVARRRYLTALCSTCAAAVAGCSASDGNGDSDGSPDDSDGVPFDGDRSPTDGNPPEEPPEGSYPRDADAYFQARNPYHAPAQYDWNPFTYPSPDDRFGLFAQWTQYLLGEDEFHPHLIREWEHGDGELVLTLSEEFTWGKTGEPVTSADLALQLSIYEAAGHLATRFVEDAIVTGDFELTISYSAGTNADLIEYTLLPLLADTAPSDWNDADWEDDPSTVTIRDPDASGPLFLTDLSDNGGTTAIRDGLAEVADHPIADHYNWRGYELRYASAEWYPLQVPETDGVYRGEASRSLRREQPDSAREFQFSLGSGLALWFDHSREPWSYREARQALMHAIAPASIQEELGVPTRLHPAPTGLTAPAVDHWLESDAPDGFDTYDGGQQRATELLDRIGYSPSDIDATVTYPSGRPTWAIACQVIVDQLQAAGWDVSGESVGGSTRDVFTSGNFDIVAYSFTPSSSFPSNPAYVHHPYFTLEHIIQGHLDEDGHFANYVPGTVTVDGEGTDVEAEHDRLARTTPRDEQRPIARRLARAVNEDLPCAIVLEDVVQSFIDTEQFAIPEDSPHFQSRWPQWWLPKVEETLPDARSPGLMKYDGE